MALRRILQVFLWVMLFVAGYLASSLLRHTLHFDLLGLFLREEKAEEEAVRPESFFQELSVYELTEFDKIYEQRQNELRDIIAEGGEKGEVLIPKGVFAQVEAIQAKINFLNAMPAYSEKHTAVRDAVLSAYQLLKETYEQEIAFLQALPTEGQNVKFVTGHIFEISAKAQRSGYQYLSSLVSYRKLLAETIRENETLESNQARIRDLVTLNSLVEKYKALLNVTFEAI